MIVVFSSAAPPPAADSCASVSSINPAGFCGSDARCVSLKLSQYSVLAHLSDEPQTLLQLADRLELDRTTLTRNLRPLLMSGGVREVDGNDGRQRPLVWAAAGQRVR